MVAPGICLARRLRGQAADRPADRLKGVFTCARQPKIAAQVLREFWLK